jgi:multimeric flavodoxin WrbA
MKAVLFNCSPRPEGNTSFLLKRMAGIFKEAGAESRLVQVGGELIRGCQACGRCKVNKDGHCIEDRDIINSCIDLMVDSDAIVIGSPVYFSQMTTEAKALIDRCGYVAGANGKLLSRKIGAAVVVGRRAGRMTTFNAINPFFLINDMIVPGSTYWNVGVARDPGEIADDEEGLQTMDRLAENILWLDNRLNAK